MRSHIESGVELLARLSERPQLTNIGVEWHLHDLKPSDVIEIIGDSSTGKTLTLFRLLGKCLLSEEKWDMDQDDDQDENPDEIVHSQRALAVLINANQQFCALKFLETVEAMIIEASVSRFGNTNPKRTALECLRNLVVLNCYGYEQFLLALYSLGDLFLRNANVSLLAIDGITSYYWQDREASGLLSIEHYARKILKLVQATTSRFNVMTIYTRFHSEPMMPRTLLTSSEHSRCHRIFLHKAATDSEPELHSCSIHPASGDAKQARYKICAAGVKWQ